MVLKWRPCWSGCGMRRTRTTPGGWRRSSLRTIEARNHCTQVAVLAGALRYSRTGHRSSRACPTSARSWSPQRSTVKPNGVSGAGRVTTWMARPSRCVESRSSWCVTALSPKDACTWSPLRPAVGTSPLQCRSCTGRLRRLGADRFPGIRPPSGAAQESNLPTVGLPRPGGFEDGRFGLGSRLQTVNGHPSDHREDRAPPLRRARCP